MSWSAIKVYGQSGYSGYSGASGFSGYSGSGYSGYSGAGTSGYSGYSGLDGAAASSGYSGYSGPAGSPGFGSTGASGFSGYSGKSGFSGYSGYSGATGIQGDPGVGVSGFSGYSGFSGKSGFSGYSGLGTSGYSGYSGTGSTGSSGFSGYSGSASSIGETAITITADTNNQALSTASNVFLITNNTSDGLKITGFTNGSAGREVVIKNVGSKTIIIPDQSSSSTAANRVASRISGVDFVIRPGDLWKLAYNNTDSRWNIISGFEEWLRDRAFNVDLNEDFLGFAGYQTLTNVVGQNNLFLHLSGSSSATNNANYNQSQVGGFYLSASGGSGYAGVYIDNWGNLSEAVVSECRIKLSGLSLALSEFELRFGIGQQTVSNVMESATPTAFTGIRYKRASSVNWQIISRSGGVETATTSSTAVGTIWTRLKMVLNTAQSSVEGFIDDVSIGTIASNIPIYSNNDVLPIVLTIYETSGNPGPAMYVDYINLRNIRTTRR